MNIPLLISRAGTTVLFVACCGAVAAEGYPSLLPPEDVVLGYIDKLPEIRAARANMELAAAEARQLRAGPYEWTANATVQRRTERTTSTSYRENGLGLERPLRWFGKAGKDAAIGDQKMDVARYAFADAWHEAGRLFLKDWYTALREARAASLLLDQVSLQERQLETVRKRIKAGDAPRMDLLLAEAERDRAIAAQRQAAQRAARAAAELRQRYEGAQPVVPQILPPPEPASRHAGAWARDILLKNHEIELANAEAFLARLAAQRNSLNRTPDPTVGIHAMHERDRQERVVGVTISIPIPGAARRSQSDASAAAAVMAQEKSEQVRNRIEREAAAIAMAAESAYENWERLAALAARSRENTALMFRAYSLGEVPIGEALLAQRQALESIASAESAQFDAVEAQARLMLDAHNFWDAFPHEPDAR